MFHLEDVLQLQETEKVHHVVRRHVFTLFPHLIIALACIVIPFFFLYPLFSWHAIGIAIFFGSVITGIVIALRAVLLWDADVFVITDLRVVDVDQQGLLTRSVAEAALSAIQDVRWHRQGVLQTIFRIGNLSLKTAGSNSEMMVVSIPHPEHLYARVNALRHGNSPSQHIPTPLTPTIPMNAETTTGATNAKEEKIQEINAMLEAYALEDLIKVAAVLKARESSKDETP